MPLTSDTRPKWLLGEYELAQVTVQETWVRPDSGPKLPPRLALRIELTQKQVDHSAEVSWSPSGHLLWVLWKYCDQCCCRPELKL